MCCADPQTLQPFSGPPESVPEQSPQSNQGDLTVLNFLGAVLIFVAPAIIIAAVLLGH